MPVVLALMVEPVTPLRQVLPVSLAQLVRPEVSRMSEVWSDTIITEKSRTRTLRVRSAPREEWEGWADRVEMAALVHRAQVERVRLVRQVERAAPRSGVV